MVFILVFIYFFFKACYDFVGDLLVMSDIISGPPVLWVAASGIKGPVQDGPDSPLWLLGRNPMFRYGGKTPEKIVMFFCLRNLMDDWNEVEFFH